MLNKIIALRDNKLFMKEWSRLANKKKSIQKARDQADLLGYYLDMCYSEVGDFCDDEHLYDLTVGERYIGSISRKVSEKYDGLDMYFICVNSDFTKCAIVHNNEIKHLFSDTFLGEKHLKNIVTIF